MNVKELKERLSKFDDNLEVAVYCTIGEDMDEVHSVRIESKNGKKSYCKGDHLLDCMEDVNEILVIG